MRNNPEIPPHFRLTAIEETEYWDTAYLAKIGCGRIWGVFLYDESVHTHLCEFTPSFELQPCYLLTENHVESDRDQQDLFTEWWKSEEPFGYRHVHDTTPHADIGNIFIDKDGEQIADPNDDKEYQQTVRDFMSEMTCNGEPLWWENGEFRTQDWCANKEATTV